MHNWRYAIGSDVFQLRSLTCTHRICVYKVILHIAEQYKSFASRSVRDTPTHNNPRLNMDRPWLFARPFRFCTLLSPISSTWHDAHVYPATNNLGPSFSTRVLLRWMNRLGYPRRLQLIMDNCRTLTYRRPVRLNQWSPSTLVVYAYMHRKCFTHERVAIPIR